MPPFIDLNADQAREVINTAQHYAVWREAKTQVAEYRRSMVWSTVKGQDYLIRAGYDKGGKRKQKSLGPRDADRERIKPMHSPPWKADQSTLGGGLMDLDSAEIEGLVWHESAPAFEAMSIDSRGAPLRLVTYDPRVFAIHKQWLSKRPDRAVFKQRRDTQQARATVALIRQHMPHLPLDRAELKMLPKAVVDDALDQLGNAPDPNRWSQIPTTPFG
jgi:Nucleotidyltransferase